MNWWVFGAAPFLLVSACSLLVGVWAGRVSMLPRVREAASLFQAPVVPVSVEVAAYRELVAVQEARIALVEAAVVSPVSPFTVLPSPARVPSRYEVLVSENLAVEVVELQGQVAALTDLLAVTERKRALHWNTLKRLRSKVRGWVPSEVAEFEADLRARALSVARATTARAQILSTEKADLETAITEIEVAAAEAQTLDELMHELGSILESHQIGAAA